MHPMLTKTVGDRFARETYTLDEVLAYVGLKWRGEPFIRFDPDVKHQYRIIRRSGHDGTLLFSDELLGEALEPLLTRTSHYKGEPPRDGYMPRYTVGKIRRAIVFGMVDLPSGRYPGMRESVTIPVRVDWVEAPGVTYSASLVETAR